MSLPSWDLLADSVRGFGFDPSRRGEALSVDGAGGFKGGIRALPAPQAAAGLRPVGVLVAQSRLPGARIPGLAEPGGLVRACAALNRFAGAAAAGPDPQGLRFLARATLYAGDEAFATTHATLLAYAATWGAQTAYGGAERAALSRAPVAEGASAWTPEDFSAARAVLPAHLAALADPPSPHVLSAAVPLGEARPDARVEVRADVAHPLHGPGLFAKLTLPVRFRDQAALGQALLALNALEAEPIDAPPHYGAWAADEADRACYTCFLPNGVKLPVIQLLFGWFVVRAPLAAGALSASPPA